MTFFLFNESTIIYNSINECGEFITGLVLLELGLQRVLITADSSSGRTSMGAYSQVI